MMKQVQVPEVWAAWGEILQLLNGLDLREEKEPKGQTMSHVSVDFHAMVLKIRRLVESADMAIKKQVEC